MAILFTWADGNGELWQREFASRLPEHEFRIFPDVGDPEDIEHALVWMPPLGDLKRYPNLKAIYSIDTGKCDSLSSRTCWNFTIW